jgi:dynein heavy chain
VEAELGRSFIESPPFDLSRALADSSPATPIIFILSAGADPTNTLLRFAREKMNYGDRTHIISLGQGQGPNAMRLIQQGRRSGDWIVLQNCHLGESFMPDLERVIGEFEQPGADLHPDFRLWLTSMPSTVMPQTVLMNGVKLTTEPPKGLRANLARSYGELAEDYVETFRQNADDFTESGKPYTREFAFKKLLFALCFFHGLIQERRKFGPLGWNIRYEFNSSDLEVSQSWLRMFLQEQPNIPWESLRYVIGEVNYGGRVTDNWDRRCLNSILKYFFNPEILSESYKFSPSGVYYAPNTGALRSYVSYIDSLPFADDPQVFGMNENANIVFQQQESSRMLSTVILLQPRTSAVGGSGKTGEQLVDEIASDILLQLPNPLSYEEAAQGIFDLLPSGIMDSLATVLSHEMGRFNKLLRVIKHSLVELQKALKGLVVLSAELDMVLQSLLNNQVPKMWAAAAYPSLKPLAAFVKDLVARVDFVRGWLTRGKPKAFCLSYVFFPQGFLTGVLQAHARKYQLAIDSLGFAFNVYNVADVTEIKTPEDGAVVYGLFVDGGRWDIPTSALQDALPGANITPMMPIHFLPIPNYEAPEGTYACPVYKIATRAGTLSTTGHSTNFVLVIDLPLKGRTPDFFVLRGTAMLTQPESV